MYSSCDQIDVVLEHITNGKNCFIRLAYYAKKNTHLNHLLCIVILFEKKGM